MSMVPRKDVSFHKPAGKAEIERRKKMAEALMVQGQQPQNTEVISGVAVKQSPLAGLAKALTQGVGGYQSGQAAQMEQGREDAKRKAMADALGAYSSAGDPTKGALAMQQILMGNEETAPLALSQALENAQYDQRFPRELEMARQKAQIAQQYGGGATGGDTGVLLNRLVEVGKQSDPNYNLLNALEDLKGGAGQRGRLGADITLGREANYETQTGQNESDLVYKPKIAGESAVQTEIGKREGEAQATLQFLEANMPKFTEVTKKLSKLGQTATYTKAGQLADAAARQTDRPVSQGAIDRAEYITTIDNEVLPLLRDTFGAAFTQKEGDTLKATLGNPDLSPPEKDAALRSFMAAKTGQVQSLKRQVGPQGQGSNPAITTPYDQIQPAIFDQDQEGDTATGPNGKMIFRGGRWVPL